MTLLWVVAAIFIVFGFVVFRGAPYVPSHRNYAKLALTKLYKLKSTDVLLDLGSGDGTILRIASKQGARAVGYELNPVLVMITKFLARGDRNQRVVLADMWLADFPAETTVVYAFSVSRDSKKLAAKLQQQATKHGHQIWCITYGAGLGELEPVKVLNAHSLYLFESTPLQSSKA